MRYLLLTTVDFRPALPRNPTHRRARTPAGEVEPEPTEPDNRDETSRQNLPMTSTDLVVLAALLISCVAFLVAIADWLQLGREAPWEAAWGEDGIVVLTAGTTGQSG